jgi:hypothetical protein
MNDYVYAELRMSCNLLILPRAGPSTGVVPESVFWGALRVISDVLVRCPENEGDNALISGC